MDKIKSMIKISDRDKFLIVLVLSAAIVALAWFLGYQNISANNTTLETKKTSLEKTKKDLKEKNDNKDSYVKDTTTNNALYDSMIKTYAAGTSDPETINFLNRVESVTGTWIRSVAFSDPSVVYTFGRVATSNPNATTSTYTSDYVGYRTVISMSYEAEYAEWENLIDYINNYSSKNTIDTISMAYNESTDTVSGTITVSMYSVEGSDRNFTETKFSTTTGTDNIFSSGSAD